MNIEGKLIIDQGRRTELANLQNELAPHARRVSEAVGRGGVGTRSAQGCPQLII